MRPTVKSAQIEIEGISVVVLWKPVKNATLRVAPNREPTMTVPVAFSSAQIHELLKQRADWLKNAIRRTAEREKQSPQPDAATFRKFYDSFPALLRKWENTMNLHASKVTLRTMKSCWGSCRSKTHALTFNLYLAGKPTECVEYVIIHELAHIVHPNHSPQFWSLVEKYCPDYQRLRRLLKEQ